MITHPSTLDRHAGTAICSSTMLLCALVLCSHASGQEPAGQRLFEKKPFDRVTIIDGAATKVLTVKPLPLPGRRVPAKPVLTEKLRLRLLDDDREFELLWSHIKQVELFEQLVLAEASSLTAQGKLDEAFDYFTFLYQFYPEMDGLKPAHAAYLYQSAGTAFRQQKYDEALSVLEELFALDATYRASDSSPTLMQVLSGIADKLLKGYVDKQDYRSARVLLRRLSNQYKASAQPFAVKWQTELVRLATERRDVARAELAAEHFVEAYDACRVMQDIWPDVEGGVELTAEIARRYPLVIVGVTHPALAFDSHSLTDPAARRAGRLVERRLLEFVRFGTEGGEYICPLGTFERSEDGLQLAFDFGGKQAGSAGSQGASGYRVSQHLLEMAEPASFDYLPAWARLMATVRVKDVQRVEVDLRLPHVLPQALLRINYEAQADVGAPGVAGNGPYLVFQKQPAATRFTVNAARAMVTGGPAEVVERVYSDPQRAILALRRGEVDCLDHLFPGDVPALRQVPEIAVAAYSTPTTHVLIPGRPNPFVGNRTFRRALLYGCDRQTILDQGIMRGAALDGFRVISAPFPAPTGTGTSVAYGYDERIAPRPFDSRLAFTLRVLAERELKAEYERRQEKPPVLQPLILGHPADEVSRIACRGFVKQWQPLGVTCKLLEFPPGEFVDAKGACDLVYVQLATWEPIVDAGRLFADDGLVPIAAPFFRLTLRKIESARNWQEARARLQELHRLVHEEVVLLPLWQTYDHYAYRRSLQGPAAERATLYQDIEQWQTVPRLAGP